MRPAARGRSFVVVPSFRGRAARARGAAAAGGRAPRWPRGAASATGARPARRRRSRRRPARRAGGSPRGRCPATGRRSRRAAPGPPPTDQPSSAPPSRASAGACTRRVRAPRLGRKAQAARVRSHDGAVAGQPAVAVAGRDVAHRHPAHVAQAVDRRRRRRQRLEAPGDVLVVGVEHDRVVEEGAQRDVGDARAQRDARDDGAAADPVRRAPARQRRVRREAIGPRPRIDGRQRVEAQGAESARHVLGAHPVRRRHDAVDVQGRAALEALDPAQRLRRHRGGAGDVLGRHQLALDVVVAVEDQREAIGPLAKQRGRRAVGTAGVERDRRHGDVVAVRVGVLEQLAVVDEAVAAPAQVRVVEVHRRPQRRRAPAGGRRDGAQEVDEGDRGQRAPRKQRVERLVGVELAQHGAHAVHGRRARRGRPGRAGVRDGQDLVAVGVERRPWQRAGEDDLAQARVDAGRAVQPEVLDAGVLVSLAVEREHR